MIEANGLSKQYGTFWAVDGVSFSIKSGTVGMLGKNGAGKSTLLRILTGSLTPTTGTASIAGFDVSENSLAARRQLGFLPETPPLYDEMTSAEYLRLVGGLKALKGKALEEAIDRALEKVGMQDRRHQIAKRLSHGYRKRLGIAQAIIDQPPVLILDEPTSGLDVQQLDEFRGMIRELGKQHTIILASHNMRDIVEVCTSVMIMNTGRVTRLDTRVSIEDEVRSKFNNDWEKFARDWFSAA